MKKLLPILLFIGCATPKATTKVVQKCTIPQLRKAYDLGVKNGSGAYRYKLSRCSNRMRAIEGQLIDMNAKCNGKVPLPATKSPTGIGGLGLGGL